MVRAVVGTLLEVSNGRRQPEDMEALLEAKDRTLAGKSAPACGLFLVDVLYPDEIWTAEGNPVARKAWVEDRD
jgi:tRNA pseudouridine38-40 synthase